LTEIPIQGNNKAVDYIFHLIPNSGPGSKESTGKGVKPVVQYKKTRTEPFYSKGKGFSQLSDHVGVYTIVTIGALAMTNEVHVIIVGIFFILLDVGSFFVFRALDKKGPKFSRDIEKAPSNFKERLVLNLLRLNKTFRMISKRSKVENKFYSAVETHLVAFLAMGWGILTARMEDLMYERFINMIIFLGFMRVF